MFTVEPFKIVRYSPITAAFGGVEYSFDDSYSLQGLTQEVADVVNSVGDSLKRAYEIKTIVEQPEINFLSTKVTPIQAEIDRRVFDLDIRYGNIKTLKEIRRVCNRLVSERKDNAILFRNDLLGLYFLHVLKEMFDPLSTKDLLEKMEEVLLRIAGLKFEIVSSEVLSDYLKVDVEIRKTPYGIYI